MGVLRSTPHLLLLLLYPKYPAHPCELLCFSQCLRASVVMPLLFAPAFITSLLNSL